MLNVVVFHEWIMEWILIYTHISCMLDLIFNVNCLNDLLISTIYSSSI